MRDSDPVVAGMASDPMPLFSTNGFEGITPRKVRIGGETRNGLIATPGPFRLPVHVSRGAALEFGVGIATNRPHVTTRFTVSQERSERPSRVLWTGEVAADSEAASHWVDVRLDLSPFAGNDLILRFEVESDSSEAPRDGGYLRAVWSHPQLHTLAPRAKKQVILVSVDTLRADHLGCFGYRRATSPNIDNLARRGVVFRNAVAQAPWTTPSHFSLLTSLYPSTHRVNQDYSRLMTQLGSPAVAHFRTLPARWLTLAEVFRRAGFETGAFTGGITVAGRLGFARGFELYDENMGALEPQMHAPLRAWLERYRDRSFFLFLHTFEVHAPYTGTYFLPEIRSDANAEGLSKLGRDVDEGASRLMSATHGRDFARELLPRIDQLRNRLRELELYQPAVTQALYDGDIRNTDRHLALILESLDALGIGPDALIVLTSDHGEEFADHDSGRFYNDHGSYLYEELLRVPLILASPGRLPQGLISDAQVRLIDVMPTILDWASIEVPPYVQGASLLPLVRDPATRQDRPGFAEGSLGPHERKAIRRGQWKYIATQSQPTGEDDDGPGGDVPLAEELYDLSSDPGERRNLIAEKGTPLRELRDEMRQMLAAARSLRGRSDAGVVLDPKLAEELRSLGYVR